MLISTIVMCGEILISLPSGPSIGGCDCLSVRVRTG